MISASSRTEAERIAEQIASLLPKIGAGTLQFWGVWFGRPYDNQHRVARCNGEGALLRIDFHDDELLSIWGPKRAVIEPKQLRIGDAERIRWEWFYYGRPKTTENRQVMEFKNSVDGIQAEMDQRWSHGSNPNADSPAVQLHIL